MSTHTRPLVDKIPCGLRPKIHANSYVDFHDLLYPSLLKHTLALDSSAIGTQLTLTPKKSQPFSQLDWSLAFDMFAAAYTEMYPNAFQGLITYSHRIRLFMKQKINWAHYDAVYRREVVIDATKGLPVNWTDIKMDMYLQAYSATGWNFRILRK